jgi:hypothetical protein
MIENRNDRLTEVNRQLSEHNLKPLAKLGDADKGEIEVLSILEFHEHSKRFFTDVKFAVRFPGGNEGAFTVRFNANGATSDGAVLVVLVNGRFAIVKQWRLPLGRWTYEVPRGFAPKLDAAATTKLVGKFNVVDLPMLATLNRELGDKLMCDAQIESVTHLGKIAENSGTHCVEPCYFLVTLRVDDELLALRLQSTASPLLSVQLWSPDEVRAQIGARLADCHSITATALALRYIESLPRV